MSVVLIQSALEVALATISPAISTAYENNAFSPVAGTAYQRVYLLTAEPENREVSTRRHTERGILQVTLAYPLNGGPAAAKTRAELIRAKFYRGASFTASGVTVHIERTPEIAPGRVEGDRYEVPVKIRWFSQILRN